MYSYIQNENMYKMFAIILAKWITESDNIFQVQLFNIHIRRIDLQMALLIINKEFGIVQYFGVYFNLIAIIVIDTNLKVLTHI